MNGAHRSGVPERRHAAGLLALAAGTTRPLLAAFSACQEARCNEVGLVSFRS